MINRRDFLKMSSLAPLAGLPLHVAHPVTANSDPDLPNILVIVFDAFSARNISLYGYPRKTTPLLEELAERAVVYHNHYAGGPFTTPGTASLLTGTLPWTHRAINPLDRVTREMAGRNIYNQLKNNYHRLGYSHNYLADDLLRQFVKNIDQFVPRQDLFLINYWISDLFMNDFDTAFIAAHSAYEDFGLKVNNTIYLPEIYKQFYQRKIDLIYQKYGQDFPREVPNVREQYFILETAVDWLIDNMPQLPEPYFNYFHLFPPHMPYNTRREFVNLHDDDYLPPAKPRHPINYSPHVKVRRMLRDRQYYDEYINYVDAEFYRLYHTLHANGTLDNTWIIFTSDHGEMLERGIEGHIGYTLHQPIANIPLLIFPPGQQQRVDVYDNTSAIDILPTILQLSGNPIPEWSLGKVLPPFGDDGGLSSRPVTCVQGKGNDPHKAFKQGTVMRRQDNYKMIYYFGYSLIPEGDEYIEMYDLENDPEELENIYTKDLPLARQMREAIIAQLEEENRPYR